MEPALETARHLLTVLLNLAVALLTGASVARLWLARDANAWSLARRAWVRRAALAAFAVAVLADLAQLWLASAAMAEVPLVDAAGATWSMLRATHLGLAWSIGVLGLAVAGAGALLRGGNGRAAALLSLAGLGLFWATRGMVSHAAGDGDASLRVLADAVHLGLASLWVGAVMLAAALLPARHSAMSAADRRARAAYVASLSNTATMALAGILATGVYASWHSLGGLDGLPGKLAGSAYGKLLAAKLLLVGAAVLLGGLNRLAVMPPWLAQESAGQAAPPQLPRRFGRVLWIEAGVLLAVLAAAAWLAATPPPS